MKTKWSLRIFIFSILCILKSHILLAEPQAKSLNLHYMTAAQMQAMLMEITGFYHPGFDNFADVIGRIDEQSGLRTNDRPTVISILFIKQISESIAHNVFERELFLDDSERHVFQGLDLEKSPSEKELMTLIDQLYEQWLHTNALPEIKVTLIKFFRKVENKDGLRSAYESFLATLLCHGGLYYY